MASHFLHRGDDRGSYRFRCSRGIFWILPCLESLKARSNYCITPRVDPVLRFAAKFVISPAYLLNILPDRPFPFGISEKGCRMVGDGQLSTSEWVESAPQTAYRDRKSTRLNSSHVAISYAV